MRDASNPDAAVMTIDLPDQEIVRASGQRIGFDVDPSIKERLLKGLDDLDLTLRDRPAIEAFVASRKKRLPWL